MQTMQLQPLPFRSALAVRNRNDKDDTISDSDFSSSSESSDEVRNNTKLGTQTSAASRTLNMTYFIALHNLLETRFARRTILPTMQTPLRDSLRSSYCFARRRTIRMMTPILPMTPPTRTSSSLVFCVLRWWPAPQLVARNVSLACRAPKPRRHSRSPSKPSTSSVSTSAGRVKCTATLRASGRTLLRSRS